MADAAPVINGSVSELSVIYHPKQNAWLATYEASGRSGARHKAPR